MTTAYAGTPTHHATINLPEDSDEVSGALFQDPLSALKDDIELLRLGLPSVTAGTKLLDLISSGAGTMNATTGAATFAHAFSPADGKPSWVQVEVASASVSFEIDLPVGAQITYIQAVVKGIWNGSSHGGSLPATLPRVSICRVDVNGTLGFLTDIDDASGSAAAYDGVHTIEGVAAVTIAAGYRYFIRVRGEASTNAIPRSFTIYGITILTVAP